MRQLSGKTNEAGVRTRQEQNRKPFATTDEFLTAVNKAAKIIENKS